MSSLIKSRKSHVFAVLNQISQKLLSTEKYRNTKSLLKEIATSAKDVLNADLIEIYEYLEDQEKYELPQVAAGTRLVANVPKVKVYKDDAIWKLIQRTEPFYQENAQASETLKERYSEDRKDIPSSRFVIRENIQSMAAIPLRTNGESMGLMFANYRSEKKFDHELRMLIELFASQAAIAIKNIRSFQNEYNQSKALADLNAFAQDFVYHERTMDTKNLLERIATSAKEVLDAELVELYEYSQNEDVFVLPHIIAGKRKNNSIPKEDIYQDDAVFQLIHSPDPLFVEDAQKAAVFMGPYKIKRKDQPKERFVVREEIQSTAAVPLRTEDESMGLMFANYRNAQKFTKPKRELIELFARQAAIAIKNARAYKQEQDRINALTELNKLSQELVSIELVSNSGALLKKVAVSAKKVLKADLIEFYEYKQFLDKYTLPQIAAGKRRVENVPKVQIYQDDAIWKLIHRKSPYYQENAQASEDLTGQYSENRADMPDARFVIRENIQSTAAIPLKVGDESLGLMFANYRRKQKFTPEVRELIELFAGQAAIAIQNTRQYEKQAALIEIGQKLTAEIRLRESEILQLVYDRASKLLNMDNSSIALYDEMTGAIHFALAKLKGQSIDTDIEPGWEPRQEGEGKTEKVLRTRKPLLLSTQADVKKAGFAPIPGKRGVKGPIANSWIGVPMIVGTKVLGVISAESYNCDNYFKQNDVDVLQALANQAAIALDHARMYYEVFHRYSSLNRRQKALIKFASMLSTKVSESMDVSQSTSIIFDFIHTQARKFMDTDNMYIALYDENIDTVSFGLVFVNGDRIDISNNESYLPRKAGKGKTEEIIQTQKPIFHATWAEADSWYKQPGRKEYTGKVLPSWIGVPMMVSEKAIGVIATYHPKDEYVYRPDDLDILQSMADLAAIALENIRLYKEAEQLRDERIASEQFATLGTAMATIQHRINNTFHIINPNLERLKKHINMQDKNIWDIIEMIERNARTTSDIITKIQEPLREQKSQSVDINAVLEEELIKAKDKWPGSKAKVYKNLDDSIPRFLAPIGQVAEVFGNLIENSYRAMRDKNGKLTIETKFAKNQIIVNILDTGSGISPEIQKALFKKPISSEGHSGSSGLGLWLSALILRKIGGTIDIVKTSTKGTEMTVRIPQRDDTAGGAK